MDPALQRIVIEKLEAEERAAQDALTAPKKKGRPAAARPEGWDYVVLAALEGAEALARQLDALAPAAQSRPARPALPAVGVVPGIFVRKLRVQGFRGIGAEAVLDLNPGPGLTLVVGRNGSGKSSFAEALELLLTGDTFRWAQRTAVWREGWRNLHEVTGARISADFAVEGVRTGVAVTRSFADGGGLTDGETRATRSGQAAEPVESLGWGPALSAWRPFLSYSELGTTFDTPSELHDRLAQVLGLEELARAQKLLADERLARSKPLAEASQARDGLLGLLTGHGDPRAAAVREALAADDWGLAAVAAVLESAGEAASEADMTALRLLAAAAGPTTEAVASVARELRDADGRARVAAASLAARSLQLAELLDHALRFHEAQGDGPCPVCGRAAAMDAAWHRARATEAEGLRATAQEAVESRRALERAKASAKALLTSPPTTAFTGARALGLDVAPLVAALESWTAALDKGESSPPTCADALEAAAEPLRAALATLATAARAELARREEAWRPLQRRLLEWLPGALRARAAAGSLGRIEAAESWLNGQARALRTERFAPIAKRAIAIWEQLRLQSNVALREIALEGGARQRRVALDVSVDGVESVALGVMSQGEIHALALSLFLPRATLPESPFRFVVIDDPVQSMDPARVEGLARVLAEVARERQVIVFTHDDRLAESVRRLGLDASILAVTRREGSRVEVTPNADPVDRAIGDALALAKTDGLPAAAARRVVPGLCRHALEAACMEAVRRRRLGRGEAHDDVQVLLADRTTRQLAALVLFDDAERAGDVIGRVNKERSRWADAFRWSNEGAHEEQAGPLVERIQDARDLARWLAKQ